MERRGRLERPGPGGAYHFAQVNGQFSHHHTESRELLKYAGDVFTRQTTDLSRLHIWMQERRTKTANDFTL